MSLLKRFAELLALGSLAASAQSQGQVWIVDSHGQGDFLDIQPAVDAAQDGDTILLVPRWASSGYVYGAADIVDKALHIAAIRGSVVRTGSIWIENLSQGKVLALSNLRITQGAPAARPGIAVVASAGSVHVSRCIVDRPSAQSALLCFDAQDVTLVHSQLIGGESEFNAAPGVEAIASRFATYGVTIEGGNASDQDFGTGGAGAPGIRLREGCEVFLHSTSVRGGEGGWTCNSTPGVGGPGTVLEEGSRIWALGSQSHGGWGGCQGGFICGTFCSSNGQPIVTSGGSSWTDLDLPVRRLSYDHSLQASDHVRLRIEGVPGDQVWLGDDDTGTLLLSPDRGGVVHLPSGLPGQFLGTLPAHGLLAVDVPLPPPGPAQRARRTIFQLNLLDADGRRLLGPPVLIETLDPSLVSFCERAIHVRSGATPGGDGTSWADAFGDLQEALSLAQGRVISCNDGYTECWIAEGTYTPGPPGSPRSARFVVPHSVALLGGFAGHETSADERDAQAHPTILSGDLEDDDLPDFGNRSDNTYRVVDMTSNTSSSRIPRLESLTVRGGHADGVSSQRFAAGVLFQAAMLRECRIVDNFALDTAGGISGGGTSPSWIVDCEVRGNRASSQGGGGTLFARVHVLNSIVSDNELLGSGGRGGGFSHRTFVPWAQGSYDGTVFSGNRAARGAALTFQVIVPTQPQQPFTVTNLTLVDNHAELDGGGVYVETGHLRIRNSILWDNTAGGLADQRGQFVADASGTQVLLERCCVQGLAAPSWPGNFALDPLLDANLELLPGSPCIDVGANALVAPDRLDLDGDLDTSEPQPFDRLGRPRFVDDPAAPDRGIGPPPLVDLGAHERTP